METIKRFFKIDERKTSIKTELLAGLTTFLAMVYVLPVNADILSATGMPYGGVFLATALAAIIATLIMGLVANFPIALAPGMGINAFFAFTVVFGMGMSWQFALAGVFISGILFLLVSVTGLRKQIIDAIPMGMKYAIGGGIGFFIAFIGLQGSGIIVHSPDTVATLGDFTNGGVLLTLFGLALVLVLFIKKNKYSLIIAMAATAVVGLIFGLIFPEQVSDVAFGLPEFKGDFSLDDLGSISDIFGKCFEEITNVLTSKEGWLIIFTFLFVDFFDTAGTLSAVGVSANLVDTKTGELVDADKALLADSIGTVVGAVLGTSTTTSYVESQTGIEQGGRTGLTAVTVAVLFALAIVLYPLFAVFSTAVTSIALIMVGALMIGQLGNIDWNDTELRISAFFTIIFMTLTYSIAEGIAFGFIIYALLMAVGERRKEVSNIMYGLAVFFVVYYVYETLVHAGII